MRPSRLIVTASLVAVTTSVEGGVVSSSRSFSSGVSFRPLSFGAAGGVDDGVPSVGGRRLPVFVGSLNCGPRGELAPSVAPPGPTGRPGGSGGGGVGAVFTTSLEAVLASKLSVQVPDELGDRLRIRLGEPGGAPARATIARTRWPTRIAITSLPLSCGLAVNNDAGVFTQS